MPTLVNEFLEAEIALRGAELKTLRCRKTGVQVMWEGDPRWWGKTAPILFPIVGRMVDDRFRRQGREYRLPQHGYARDATFQPIRHDVDRIELAMSPSTEHQAGWPFALDLELDFTLSGSALRQRFCVRNAGTSEAFFSFGFHPGFRCPLFPGEVFEDYVLEFSEPETLARHGLQGGLRTGATTPLLADERRLALDRQLFAPGAVVLQGARSRAVRLVNPAHGHGVEVALGEAPWLGFWTKGDGAFLCIEPWYGVADRSDHDGSLETKEGLHRLAPEETTEGAIEISVV